jgi:2-keto-4-pentenoate hydratase/2-oxohepta-3-ene-1,7-dioic acid hydratase in catechol pathway
MDPWDLRSYIMVGTPAGAVRNRDPSFILRKGDKVVFHVSHEVGTLINTICEKRGRWVTGENNVP